MKNNAAVINTYVTKEKAEEVFVADYGLTYEEQFENFYATFYKLQSEMSKIEYGFLNDDYIDLRDQIEQDLNCTNLKQ